jgi:SAM-dependent methyltransferase
MYRILELLADSAPSAPTCNHLVAMSGEMRTNFAGATACSYVAYRRDVPAKLIDAAVEATGLTDRELALDLGCGTGQAAVPLARHARAVLALDPEPDMLVGLRARLDAQGVTNVLPALAADRDLSVIETVYAGLLAVVTVANALHWMDAEQVFTRTRRLLRDGGGLVIVSQGPPMWLSDSDWSRELRAVLQDWTGGSVSASCGTDRDTLEQRVHALRDCGYERVEVIEHPYEAEIDLGYVVGHLRSAMSESVLAPDRQPEFEARVHAALEPHLRAGPLVERIDATAVIAVSHVGA